jgi:hypothetical protein
VLEGSIVLSTESHTKELQGVVVVEVWMETK